MAEANGEECPLRPAIDENSDMQNIEKQQTCEDDNAK
jgi:hypothetical protein